MNHFPDLPPAPPTCSSSSSVVSVPVVPVVLLQWASCGCACCWYMEGMQKGGGQPGRAWWLKSDGPPATGREQVVHIAHHMRLFLCAAGGGGGVGSIKALVL